ncbi:MAG: SNF2 helicase associated domain-containing protein [Lachnospiraceae bacterium]|nr:SNF2 helicase associated domain-containing protein [Lachnospiraceae bacterium]
MYDWKKTFPMTSLGNGKILFERNKVRLQKEAENEFSAKIIEYKTYHVRVLMKPESSSYRIKCDCPVATGGQYCKHMAATMYAIEWQEEHPEVVDKKAVEAQTEVQTIAGAQLSNASEMANDDDTMVYGEKMEGNALAAPGMESGNIESEEAAYIIMNASEEESDIPAVSWEQVELEKYSYFSGAALMAYMNFPERIIRNAKRLVKEKRVALVEDDINTGYYERGEDMIGECVGNAWEGTRAFPVHIVFDRNEVIHTECRCRECSRYYYYGINKCEYVAAMLLLLSDFLKNKNLGDATDKAGRRFLTAFRQKYAAEMWKGQKPIGEKYSLRPRLLEKEGLLLASFRIEGQKSFVIKDLEAFYDNVESSATATYGSSTQINHDMQNFTETARKWIAYIGKIISEERAYENVIEEQGGYIGHGSDKKNAITLFGTRLDEFYEMLGEDSVEYEKRDAFEKDKKLLKCKEGNPRVQLDIRKNDISTRNEFHGIEVSYDMPTLFAGLKTGYFIEGKGFYRVQEEFYHKVEILNRLTEEDATSFQIGRNFLTEFYHTVLPQLQQVADITESDYEEIAGYLPPKVKFVFYLDVEKGDMSCKVMARYGDREYNAMDVFSNQGCESYREIGKEAEVLIKAKQWFPYEDESGMEINCGGDESLMYEVLHSGLEILFAIGEVRCTRRFSNLKLSRKLRLSVGVSLSNGLLNLNVSAEDISQEEVADILKSYRAKKKYHKLKNGDFLNLEDEAVVALGEMAEILRLSPKELIKGNMHLPAYRALYLDKLLERNEEIYNTRDSHFRALVKNFKTISDADFDEPESLKCVMREYQRTGYKWLRTLEQAGFGGILADDMGLGKTLQVIAVLLAAKEAGKTGPSLVVSPASLVYNWSEEIKRFAPELTVGIVTGTQEERQKKLAGYYGYDVLLTSYDLLKRDIAYYEDKQFLYQIIDEAQYIKNHTTAAAKAVKVITSKVRFALTGTPIENRLSELWSIFDYLMPGYLYGYETFHSEFEIPIVKFAEQEAFDRLKRLTAPFIMRRLKENVLKDLPDKLEESYYVKLEGEQQRLYDAQVLHMKQQIAMQNAEEFKQNKLQVLAELMRIRQICCDPSLCYDNYKGDSAKLETCLELLKSAIEGGHRILVFSQFTSMLDILQDRLDKEGIDYFTITGSVSKEKRLELVQQFNEGHTPIFLISLKAGGVGLNLTGADMVVHYDPWWNLAVQNQATDRAHRIGQTKKVVVYKLIAKDTIEEKIQKLQEDKKSLSEQIISGDANALSSMTKDDFLELLT